VSAAHRYVVVDFFTDVPLEGNQLAVFTDAAALPEEALQRLARELSLSETVYVLAPEHGGDARIRIFTPAAELPFAGHPVLGTAIVVGIERGLEQVTLETSASGSCSTRSAWPARACRSRSTSTVRGTCTWSSRARSRWRR
jgi:trans-2,3-dihydro-3-hydroxyanthranilate isomerase